MKKLFTTIFAIVLFYGVNAQVSTETLVIGDTIKLNLSGGVGDIQWQESGDSLSWSNILGATATSHNYIINTAGTGKLYLRAMLMNSDCTLDPGPYYSSVIEKNVRSDFASVQVGDWFRGGIVYSVDGVGNGLISSESDQAETVEWGCWYSFLGATSLTDGAANTATIVSGCSTSGIAADIINQLELNGYSDWFLPAQEQLYSLYEQRDLVGGFDGGLYWSSTEHDDQYAVTVYFTGGFISHAYGKYEGFDKHIRAVRAFTASDDLIAVEELTTVSGQSESVQILTQPTAHDVCLGDATTLSISASGTLPITYQWKKDGAVITGEISNSISISSADLINEGIYTCEATNVCKTETSAEALLNVVSLSMETPETIVVCPDLGKEILTSITSNHPDISGMINYSWSPSEGLSDTAISNPVSLPADTTLYTVVATDEIGCYTSENTWVEPQFTYQGQEICLVSVDPDVGKNKILWVKTPDVGIESYLVQKEIATGIYSILDVIPATDTNIYIDYLSDPESHSDLYKITVLDTCGNDSEIDSCAYHKTINLTLSNVGSTMYLDWEAYEVEDGSYVPSKYYIYRGVDEINLELIDSVTGSVHTYNDVGVYEVYHYLVGAVRDDCLEESNYAFSNRKDNEDIILSLLENNNYLPLSIYPNPASGIVYISIPKSEKGALEVRITDITGKSIHLEATIINNQLKLDINKLNPGIYFVELNGSKNYKGKLIKQ